MLPLGEVVKVERGPYVRLNVFVHYFVITQLQQLSCILCLLSVHCSESSNMFISVIL